MSRMQKERDQIRRDLSLLEKLRVPRRFVQARLSQDQVGSSWIESWRLQESIGKTFTLLTLHSVDRLATQTRRQLQSKHVAVDSFTRYETVTQRRFWRLETSLRRQSLRPGQASLSFVLSHQWRAASLERSLSLRFIRPRLSVMVTTYPQSLRTSTKSTGFRSATSTPSSELLMTQSKPSNNFKSNSSP